MPYLGSTVFIGSLVLSLLVSLTGYFLLVRSLAPAFVDRAERAATERPLASALVGFPVAILAVVLTAVLVNVGPGPAKASGLLFLGLSLGLSLSGVAGLAQRVGRSLPSPSDDARPWLRALRGGIVLELALLLPLVGWFVVLPLTLAMGTGAACLSALGVGAARPSPSRAPATAV